MSSAVRSVWWYQQHRSGISSFNSSYFFSKFFHYVGLFLIKRLFWKLHPPISGTKSALLVRKEIIQSIKSFFKPAHLQYFVDSNVFVYLHFNTKFIAWGKYDFDPARGFKVFFFGVKESIGRFRNGLILI